MAPRRSSRAAAVPIAFSPYEAVTTLRARGFRVRRFEDGLPEWRAAGLPVVTSGDAARA